MVDSLKRLSEDQLCVLFVAEPSRQFLAKSGLFLVIWACDDYWFMGNVDGPPELARTLNFLHSFRNICGGNGNLFRAYKSSSIPGYLLDCVCSRPTGAME